jgi:hypothetical protein
MFWGGIRLIEWFLKASSLEMPIVFHFLNTSYYVLGEDVRGMRAEASSTRDGEAALSSGLCPR